MIEQLSLFPDMPAEESSAGWKRIIELSKNISKKNLRSLDYVNDECQFRDDDLGTDAPAINLPLKKQVPEGPPEAIRKDFLKAEYRERMIPVKLLKL